MTMSSGSAQASDASTGRCPKAAPCSSDFAKRMAKAKLLPRTTTRNLNTVQKLLTLG